MACTAQRIITFNHTSTIVSKISIQYPRFRTHYDAASDLGKTKLILWQIPDGESRNTGCRNRPCRNPLALPAPEQSSDISVLRPRATLVCVCATDHAAEPRPRPRSSTTPHERPTTPNLRRLSHPFILITHTTRRAQQLNKVPRINGGRDSTGILNRVGV